MLRLRTAAVTPPFAVLCRARRMCSAAQSSNGPTMKQALRLEKIDVDLYRQHSGDLWVPPTSISVFGGQIAAGAMMAAQRSLDGSHANFSVSSLHSYFLTRGDPTHDIVYTVNRLRDGRSFATRSVVAKQNGTAIFGAEIQFAKEETNFGVEHQVAMPQAPPPESLPSLNDLYRKLLGDPRIKEKHVTIVNKYLKAPFPVEIRHCNPQHPLHPAKVWPARQLVWMRCTEALGEPTSAEDLYVHRSAVAYASDWSLSSTMFLPLGISFGSSKIAMVASLDHVMHFHALTPFRADEWMLYELESPILRGTRGLNHGRIFTRDGRLVASCVQEALVRLRGEEGASGSGGSAPAAAGGPASGASVAHG